MKDEYQRLTIISVNKDLHYDDEQFHKILKTIILDGDYEDGIVSEGHWMSF